MGSTVENHKQNSNNDREYVFIHHPEGSYLKIDKRDFKPENDPHHEHHYKPDYSDETEDYIAFTCVVGNCSTGRLMKKDDNLKELLKGLGK